MKLLYSETDSPWIHVHFVICLVMDQYPSPFPPKERKKKVERTETGKFNTVPYDPYIPRVSNFQFPT